MREKPISVGLIGLGKMGQNHLRVLSLLKSVDLVFIADLDAPLVERLAHEYGTQGTTAPELYFDKVQAVVICTPTSTHESYIRLAAPQVKHIFVEKPLVRTVQEARTIREFVTDHGVNLRVGFIERFNPAVQALKRVLDQADQVISIDFTRTNKLSSRITDVDVVTDLMIHDIDLALFLNGPARSTVAHGYDSDGLIQFASAFIVHENGRFSRIQASRVTEKKKRLIEATCLGVFVDCELLRKEIVLNRQSEIRQAEGQPYTISATQETVEVGAQEALLSELQAFVASCRGQATPELPGVDAGLAAMEICNQIQQAVLS